MIQNFRIKKICYRNAQKKKKKKKKFVIEMPKKKKKKKKSVRLRHKFYIAFDQKLNF